MRHLRGFTFIEVLVSAVCLSVIAVGVAASLDFASKHSAIASEQALANGVLRQYFEAIRGQADSGQLAAGTTTYTPSVTGIPGSTVTIKTTVTQETGSTTLFDVDMLATWNHGSVAQSVHYTSTVFQRYVLSLIGTYTVTPTGTFSTLGGTRPATVVNLATAGITPGMTIMIRRQGSFNYGSGQAFGMVGMFSSTSTARSDTAQPQIAGAIACGGDTVLGDTVVTTCAPATLQAALQPESFLIAEGGSSGYAVHDSTTVEVPPGAAYLFLMPEDTVTSDDSLTGSPYFRAAIYKQVRPYVTGLDNTITTATYDIDPKGTFSSGDAGNRPATVVDLGAIGVKQGSKLVIARLGNFYHTGTTAWYGMWGCFSTTSTQLTTTGSPQISGAIGSGALGAWKDTQESNSATVQTEEPAQAFLIADQNNLSQSSVSVTVPAGAKYLFLVSGDISQYSDNAVGSAGFFRARVDYQPGATSVTASVLADTEYNWGDQGEGGWTYGYYTGTTNPSSVTAANFNLLKRINDVAVSSYGGFSEHNNDSYDLNGDTYGSDASRLNITNLYMSSDTSGTGGINAVVGRRWTCPWPYSSVTASGTFRCRANSCNIVIAKNVTTILWSSSISDTSTHSFNVSIGTLNEGDTIEVREYGANYTPVEYYMQVQGQ